MPTDYDYELSKINSDEEKYKEVIASRRTSLINGILEDLGLPRNISYDHALCLIHRNISVWKKLQSDPVSTDELMDLRAKARAYDNMRDGPSVFVDEEDFNKATQTYIDPNVTDWTEAVELHASNNKVEANEIRVVRFISCTDTCTDES